MQKSAALGKTPPSFAKWGLQGHGSLTTAVHLLHKKVSTCLTWHPSTTFSSSFRLTGLLVREGFCPSLLILHRTGCTDAGRHRPTPQQWPWSHSGLEDVGWPAEHIVQPLSLGGCRQEALTVAADEGVSLFSFPSPVMLCLEPNPLFFPCCWAATFWSMQKSHDTLGKEGWCNGVQQQTGNIVLLFKGSFSPTGKKLKDNSCFEGEAYVAQENTKYVVHSVISSLEQAVPVRNQEGLKTRGSEPDTKVPFESLALCFLGTEKLACEFLSQDDAGWWCLVFSSSLSFLLTHPLRSLRAMYSFLLGGILYFLAVLYFLHFLHAFPHFCLHPCILPSLSS